MSCENSIVGGGCIKCDFINPRKLTPKKDIPANLVAIYEKFAPEHSKREVRKMFANKTKDGWAMFCEKCFVK